MRSTIFRPADTHPSKQTCTHAQSDRGINRFPHTRSLPLSSHLLAALSLPQVSSPLVFAVFCLLSTSLQYWWGLEVQPAAGHTVWGASYTVSVLEWFVYLKTADTCWGLWCVCSCVQLISIAFRSISAPVRCFVLTYCNTKMKTQTLTVFKCLLLGLYIYMHGAILYYD